MHRVWMQGALIASLVIAAAALSLALFHKQWLNNHTLKHALQSADLVTISQYGTAQDGTQITGPAIDVLTESRNTKMLLLLKTSAGFHTKPPSAVADYMFGLEGSRERSNSIIVSYVIKTGELGHDHDWCYAPIQFRAWVKTIPKPHHPKYKILRTPWYENVQEVK